MKNPVSAVTPSKATMKTAVAVAIGIGLFGAILYFVRRAPDNALTKPLKSVADVAATK